MKNPITNKFDKLAFYRLSANIIHIESLHIFIYTRMYNLLNLNLGRLCARIETEIAVEAINETR